MELYGYPITVTEETCGVCGKILQPGQPHTCDQPHILTTNALDDYVTLSEDCTSFLVLRSPDGMCVDFECGLPRPSESISAKQGLTPSNPLPESAYFAHTRHKIGGKQSFEAKILTITNIVRNSEAKTGQGVGLEPS